MSGIPFHPLANLFPLIDGAEFDDLVDDVRVHGIREEIVILDGQILDGRNRYRAGVAAGLIDPGPDAWRWPVEGESCRPQFRLFLSAERAARTSYNIRDEGDPLAFVLSKNLRRRHLSESQRAMVAARLATMRQGRPASEVDTPVLPLGDKPANLPDISQGQAAELLNVSERSLRSAKAVQERGVAELGAAVEAGRLAVSAAVAIARQEEEVQREELERRGLPSGTPINGARALMASRAEPDDSLDFFPTPPWATRALVEHVFGEALDLDLPSMRGDVAWDPACGEGHITAVLEETFGRVIGTDIFDYSRDGRMPPGWFRVQDFLAAPEPGREFILADNATPVVDWIVTNPPFGEACLPFMRRALELAEVGVAMFLRLQCLEGVERYESLFLDRPPTLVAPFVERVNLCKGRWDPDGSTATAYMWLVWIRGEAPRAPFWIPPGRREALTRAGDRERFTAHPVTAAPPALVPGSIVRHADGGPPYLVVGVTPGDHEELSLSLVRLADFQARPVRASLGAVAWFNDVNLEAGTWHHNEHPLAVDGLCDAAADLLAALDTAGDGRAGEPISVAVDHGAHLFSDADFAALRFAVNRGGLAWSDDRTSVTWLADGTFVSPGRGDWSSAHQPGEIKGGISISRIDGRAVVWGYRDDRGCGYLGSTVPTGKVRSFVRAWAKAVKAAAEPRISGEVA